MHQIAAHLTDSVLPEVPIRLWTASLPFDLRRLLAARADLLSDVHRIFLRLVFRFLRQRAFAASLTNPRFGAVSFIQRFSATLQPNVHYHDVVADGVFVRAHPDAPVTFHEVEPPSALDVENIALSMAERTRASLRRYCGAEAFSLETGNWSLRILKKSLPSSACSSRA